MKRAALLLVAACLTATAVQAQPAPGNPDMQRIYAADQADRRVNPSDVREKRVIDWKAVAPRDAARRAETQKLLAAGALKSAEDFREAAFVFQHGGATDDYLLAHTLAMVAVAKGDKTAMWIAAATLDRYLMTVGQKQVFGTQFTAPKGVEAGMTQEPYERTLVSDALRGEFGVPDKAEQAKRLAEMNAAMPKP